MSEQHRVFGVIAARGGSKGLPGKNVADLGGMPVIAWSVKAAQDAQELSGFILSSDDTAIQAAARDAGCPVPFTRPETLASDDASIMDVVFHALDWLGEDPQWTVLLQASSPLRTAADIDGCIRDCIASGAPAAVSVCESAKPPQWMFELATDRRLIPIMPTSDSSRRQLLPKTFVPNGAVYVARTEWLRKTGSFYAAETIGYVMPRDRSVDIDEAIDLHLARALVSLGAHTSR